MDQFDSKTTFYLAPEEIQFLLSRGYNSGAFPNPKTEAFSLGLTILECATLTSSADLYQPTNRSFNKDEMKFRFDNLGQRYAKLSSYLQRICDIN